MRQIILAIVLFSAAFSVNAECRITYSAPDDVTEGLTQHGFGFKKYEVACNKLKKANAKLMMVGMATVLNNVSVAWATVRVADKITEVSANDHVGIATQVNTHASQDKANEMMIEAVNIAADTIDFDSAIKDLDKARKIAKAAYSK